MLFEEKDETKNVQNTEQTETQASKEEAPTPEATEEQPEPTKDEKTEDEKTEVEETEVEEAAVEETEVTQADDDKPEVEVAEVETPEVDKAEKEPSEPEQPLTEEERMMELYEETFNNIKPGQIVDGTVIDINDKEVLVDIGFKSEGSILIGEFSNTDLPEKFSSVKVYINAIEDGEGKLKLSKKKADFFMNLTKLREIFENRDTVIGVLKRRVKGGMIAEIFGLEAFLPGSQISLKPIPNLDQFIGKESEFKIVKLDEDRRNIIVSRKLVMEADLEEKRGELRDKITVNAELDGEVKNITDYGAFIDLGGIDGLLHITDMSWGRIKHPSEMLNIGDKLKVKVINYEPEKDRVSLGLKQLVPHPWVNIEAKYPEGTKVSGRTVNITNYGAFVELEPGVEGLVHISEMSWTKKINHPNQVLKVGETLNAIVLSVSKEQQRISLGMKQMEPNPWLTIDERYPIGTLLTRKIKSITPFGVFIEIEDDIDGLIHISDISWTKRIYHPREVCKVGQEIEALVLSIDKALHRIALGVKQLAGDPWSELDQKLPVNTEVVGHISKLIPKGVLVDVPVNDSVVEGFVPMSHLGLPRFEKLQYAFDDGEKLPLKVIELDTENRRLILSVKAYFFGKPKDEKLTFLQEHEQRIQERMEEARVQQEKKRARLEEKLREKLPQEEQVEEPPVEDAPAEKAPAEDAPTEDAPAEDVPVEDAPVEKAPVEEATTEDAPAEKAPAEDAPTEDAPAEDVPVEDAPVEEAPVEEATTEDAPVEDAPAEEAPVEDVPAEEEPVEEAPVEEAPVEEAPEEDVPVEEVPVEETPAEEAPVEEAPAEDAPAEDAPVEDTPVEDAPAEETDETKE
ncbi:MAG: 30S ribosomal protein S1 [Candidatus Cloacimonetes bacterium]|nr:30S ribosomal protein S1 [Candidatus Cloacimonadota bacterium]